MDGCIWFELDRIVSAHAADPDPAEEPMQQVPLLPLLPGLRGEAHGATDDGLPVMQPIARSCSSATSVPPRMYVSRQDSASAWNRFWSSDCTPLGVFTSC